MISDICNDITMVSDKVFKAKMQTEREKQILYINTYRFWKKWYWWTYLQGKTRDTGIENRLVDTGERRGWDKLREQHWEIQSYVKQLVGSCCITRGAQPGTLWQPRGVVWRGLEGGARGRGDMYTYGWVTMLNGRSQHNIVKQLSSN